MRPKGTSPDSAYSRLGSLPPNPDRNRKLYYLNSLPKSSLIARFGENSWAFTVGEKITFIAPQSGKLGFRINDTDKPSGARGGRLHVSLTETTPAWGDGNFSIVALVDAFDFLHISHDGLFWEYGGTWDKVGEQGGAFPTIINDVCWWPKWDGNHTAVLPLKALWPAKEVDLSLARVEARRGDVQVERASADEFVLKFSDHGLGASAVGCTIARKKTAITIASETSSPVAVDVSAPLRGPLSGHCIYTSRGNFRPGCY